VTRVFFCTDLHGSEVCFRKFLHAGHVYEADVVIMGGDCTGKMVVPLVQNGNEFTCEWAGGVNKLRTPEDIAEQEKQITNNGLYPVRVTEDEMRTLESDPARVGELFREQMLARVAAWVALAEERLADSGLEVIITPGNDDDFAVDEVLGQSDFIKTPEGTVTRIGGGRFEMLSLGWSNPTPWDTPRECSEEQLAERIRALAAEIDDMENAIFNIHVPPYGTGLDNAPELEEGQRLKRGGTINIPVGSTAVRDAILEDQPLLGLHGHIHESRGIQRLDRTVSINPGSAYSDWTLQGVIVDLEDGEVVRYVPVTG
jgi:Icc-related predicted phosphoesterase